jgi:propanol-preferring alcohol dehydrogenase
VANLTRRDGDELFAFCAKNRIQTRVKPYRLSDANRALADLRQGDLTGAAVLAIGDDVESGAPREGILS